MFPKEIFSQRLKQLRTDNKVSMQKLVDAIGLKNKGTISQFESGTTIPSVDTIIAIANYFNVSTDYLLGLSDKPERR